MDDTQARIGAAHPGLFVRDATGLVREVSWVDAAIYNMIWASVPLAIAFLLLFGPGFYTGGNLYVATIAALVLTVSTGFLYAMLSATEKANLAAAKKAYALFNKHDKKLAEVFTADVVDHDQTVPTDVKGVEAEMEHNSAFWKMASNVKCLTPVLFAAGDYTVAIGQIAGTNDGDMPAMGLKKTGKAFKVDFIEVIRWQDGKVVEEWPFFNGMQLAEQLGLLPPPGKAQASTP